MQQLNPRKKRAKKRKVEDEDYEELEQAAPRPPEGTRDEEIDALLEQLRSHPHRDAAADNKPLKKVLEERLSECERLTQLSRFKDRGFSPFEAIPGELLTVIATHLQQTTPKGQFKSFALISKPFSIVIRALTWQRVTYFKTGTVNKCKAILPTIGDLVREVVMRSKQREAQVLVEGCKQLERLELSVDKPAALIKCFNSALTREHKRLAHVHIEDERYDTRSEPLALGPLKILPALRSVTLSSIRAEPGAWDKMLEHLTNCAHLEELVLSRCHDTRPHRLSAFGLMDSDMSDDSDAEEQAILANTPDLQTDLPKHKFKQLKKLTLRDVGWNSTIGLRLLMMAGDKLESVELKAVQGKRAGGSYSNVEDVKLELAKPYTLRLETCHHMDHILAAFPLENCKHLDCATLNVGWAASPTSITTYDHVLQRIADTLEAVELTGQAADAIDHDTSAKVIKVIKFLPEGRLLRRTGKPENERQALIDRCAAQLNRLCRLAEEKKYNVEIIEEKENQAPSYYSGNSLIELAELEEFAMLADLMN